MTREIFNFVISTVNLIIRIAINYSVPQSSRGNAAKLISSVLAVVPFKFRRGPIDKKKRNGGKAEGRSCFAQLVAKKRYNGLVVVIERSFCHFLRALFFSRR